MNLIKQRRILSSPTPGWIIRDLTTLSNNEIKVTYFVEVNSNTGTITIPTGATILLNQYPGGVDALVSTVSSSQPTGDNPVTSAGITVDVSSFDALGAYTLTGVPSSYPVALIFVLKIKAIDYGNLVDDQILDRATDDSIGLLYGTTSGTDTYTTTINTVSAYTAGDTYAIKFGNANTGSATLNINSLGAKTLKKNGATNLAASDISAGQAFIVVYDGTNFQVIGLSGGTTVPYTAASASGAASLDFAEDTDNGTNKVTIQGAATVASDKTQTLQDADGIIALLAQVPYTKSTATAYTSSSTTTNEVAAAFLIPAGTCLTDAIIDIEARFEANSSANTKIVRFYQNDAATLDGSEVQLSTYSFTTNNQYAVHYRDFTVQSNTSVWGYPPATSSIGDLGSGTAAGSATTINTLASDSYIIVTVNRANSGDTLILRSAQVIITNTR